MGKTPSINLLKSKNASFIDRFITWAITAGRVVVIVVELTALSAFLYRFSLDRQLIDLHSKIKQEQAVVSYLKDSEETYKNLQNRLFLASVFASQGSEKVKTLKDVVSFAPSGMIFNNLTISEDRLRINANLNQVSALSDFVKSLKNYSKIKNVSIDKIENKPSAAVITVSITAVLKSNNLYENIK